MFDLYYWNVLQCIQALYGDPEFVSHLVFASEQYYSQDPVPESENEMSTEAGSSSGSNGTAPRGPDSSSRLYHNIHTGHWW